MALTNCYATRGVSSDGKCEMTINEFKQWLKIFDLNNDGLISEGDLREAAHVNGGWFSGRKSRWFSGRKSRLEVRSADKNGNGFIEEIEINHRVEFAQKCLGVRIVAH